MRLESIGSEITGIAMLHRRPETTIILSDPSVKVTRLFLIEEAGPKAIELGFLPGDIVLPKRVNDIVLYGGIYHRASFASEEIIKRVLEAPLSEFDTLQGKPMLSVIPESLIAIAAGRIKGEKRAA